MVRTSIGVVVVFWLALFASPIIPPSLRGYRYHIVVAFTLFSALLLFIAGGVVFAGSVVASIDVVVVCRRSPSR